MKFVGLYHICSLHGKSAAETLNACLAECIAAYNLLDIRRFDGILRNILEQGMPHTQKRVIAGEEGKHERSL